MSRALLNCLTPNPDLPSWRIRHLQAREALAALGWRTTSARMEPVGQSLPRLLGRRLRRESCMVYKAMIPGWLHRRMRLSGTRVVLDFDDLVTHSVSGERVPNQQKAFDRAVGLARGAVCGNEFLASQLPDRLPRIVLPSPVPHEVPQHQVRCDGGPLRLGWVGLPTNFVHLERILPQLLEVHRRHPFRLVVISSERPELEGLDLEFQPWSSETQEACIASLDIGLMPLDHGSIYSRGKCSYKALQYMAAGVPAVASRVGMNEQVIEPGIDGVLCEESEWVDALSTLIMSPGSRAAIGGAGRARVLSRYTYPTYVQALAAFLDELHAV